MRRLAVYAGSFDPPTNGHLWMIEQALDLFDEVHVAVAVNASKAPTFTVDERMEMLRGSLPDDPEAKVLLRELPPRVLLIRWARDEKYTHLVRGIRNAQDFEYERGMHNVNRSIARGIETVFLMPPKELAETSSSLVKGLVGLDGWEDLVSELVPEAVVPFLARMQVRR